LHDGALIFGVDFQDAVHTREDEHHAAGAGERPARESGAGATADDWNFVFGGEFDALRDLPGGCRENDDVGEAFFDRSVVLVQKEILQLVKNGVFAKKLGQLMKEAGIHGRAIAGAPGTIVRDGERAQRQDRPGERGYVSVISQNAKRG
jgi:hypothetical protein